jgi:hypothetical protein
MAKRIEVPESAVRTREQILDGMTLTKTESGQVIVWTTCWNCGGSGRYPSSMTPPGQCRLYCWDKKTPKTFGKLPYDADKYVKRAQAADRRAFRDSAKFEAERPAREAAAAAAKLEAETLAYAEELERSETLAYEMDRLRVSQFVGKPGDRLKLRVICVGRMKMSDGAFGPRYLLRMRDENGNVLTQWTGSPNLGVGDSSVIKATVKEHSEYRGEKQTVVQRVTEVPNPVANIEEN